MRTCLALAFAMAFVSTSFAQTTPEPLRGADRNAYEEMKKQAKPVVVEGDDKATAENRRVLGLQAKYLVGQLMDTQRINKDNLALVIEEAISRELPIIRINKPKEYGEKYMEFSREMGAIMIKELETAIKSPKLVVRVNAARMLSVLAMMGSAKSAELALKVLQDEQADDATKYWCLKTLTNIFEFMPDQTLPEQSAFQVKDKNRKDDRELERAAIKFLSEYVMKPRDVAGKSPEEIAAMRFVRREAITALGHARTHRLRHEGKILAHPGLVLLKVANKDGLIPEPDLKERAEAVIGFSQMFPVVRANVDRDIQLDYAAAILASAILDIVTVKVNVANDISLPWVVTGHRFDAALKQLQDNTAALNLANASILKGMYEKTKAELLEALKTNQVGVVPNAQGFRIWLQSNTAKSPALYQDEPGTTVKPVGN